MQNLGLFEIKTKERKHLLQSKVIKLSNDYTTVFGNPTDLPKITTQAR